MGGSRLQATLLLQQRSLSSHTIKSWNGRVPSIKEARNIEPFFHFDMYMNRDPLPKMVLITSQASKAVSLG